MSIRFAFVLALLFVATAGWTSNLSLLADQLAHCGSEDCGDHEDEEESELLADCGKDHGDEGEEEDEDGSETKLAHCGSEDCGDHDDEEESELLADCGKDHGDEDEEESELLA